MFSIARALSDQRRAERDLRLAGLEPIEPNLRWWHKLPAAERRLWTGRPEHEGDRDHFNEQGYADGPAAVAS